MTDSARIDTEFQSDRALARSGGERIENLPDIALAQLRRVVAAGSRFAVASVVFGRSGVEMCWIHAWRIVAAMKNSGRHLSAAMETKTESVRQHLRAAPRNELPVATASETRGPDPAWRLSFFVDVFPKAFDWRAMKFLVGIPDRAGTTAAVQINDFQHVAGFANCEMSSWLTGHLMMSA